MWGGLILADVRNRTNFKAPVKANGHNALNKNIKMSKRPDVNTMPIKKTATVKKTTKQDEKTSKFGLFYAKGEFDKPFFIIIIILLVLGTVMMFSASYAWGISETGDGFIYVKKQLGMAAVGMVIMFALSIFDYHNFSRVKFVYFIFIGALLMLAYTSFFGTEHSHARRWLSIGPIEFQSSEVMKFAIIVLFSYIISKNYKKMKKFKYGILPFGIVLSVVAVLLMKQPHLSCTILICGIGFIMILVGGANIRHMILMGLIAVGGLVTLVMYKTISEGYNYFGERIQSWLHPFSDKGGVTWQTCQSLIAIGSGGFFGMGFGNSRQKFLYLPESKNDFVFAIVCEELGFLGAMLVLILFGLFVFRGFYIASRSHDKFGMLLCLGITVQIGLQAFLNIAVVTNSIPNTGISLPFFSYGGTALIMQLAEMGVILNISRQATVDQ